MVRHRSSHILRLFEPISTWQTKSSSWDSCFMGRLLIVTSYYLHLVCFLISRWLLYRILSNPPNWLLFHASFGTSAAFSHRIRSISTVLPFISPQSKSCPRRNLGPPGIGAQWSHFYYSHTTHRWLKYLWNSGIETALFKRKKLKQHLPVVVELSF